VIIHHVVIGFHFSFDDMLSLLTYELERCAQRLVAYELHIT
jgi:hypothetical protein